MPVITATRKRWRGPNGKILRAPNGKRYVCEECPCEEGVEACTVCDTDTTPAFVQIETAGITNDFCNPCSGMNGTWAAPQVLGFPCEWGLDVAPLALNCFPVDADRYDRVNASVTDLGGGVTRYYLELLDTLSGHTLGFRKDVSGGDRNDCMAQWNSGGWTVLDGLMVDCNISGLTYTISAF